MDYIKCGGLSLLCESTMLRSNCLLVISCFLLKSITLLYYTNFLKKCGSVHGRRLEIHGNIPEKQSFEVYFSFSTSERFGCSIIDLIRLCQYQELLATSSPQRLEHVYKPNVWGTSDEMETMWSENDGKLIALIVSMVSNTQERKIPSGISRREQHRTQYWLDINIFSVSDVRKAQKYCIDSQHIELFLLIDISLFLW